MTELMANPERATTPAGLRDADMRGCRWIDGEATPLRSGMYCSAPPARPGSSWCAEHRGIVWTASRRRSPTLRKSGAARAPKPLNSSESPGLANASPGSRPACEWVWRVWYYKSFGVHGHPARGELQ
jgi:hypothetical protein